MTTEINKVRAVGIKDQAQSQRQEPGLSQTSNVAGEGVARGTALNLAGQLIPILAGLVLMPYIIKGLGADRFGVLGIVWLVYGYFSIFDFGLSSAITKFLAELLVQGEHSRVSEMVWAAILLQLVLGIAGGVVLAALSPRLVSNLLKVPQSLIRESETSFVLLACTLPVVLATSGLRATLEGCRRFDLSNVLRVPMSILAFAIPALGLWFGLLLPGIVLLLGISRLVFLFAHLRFCLRLLPCLKRWPSVRGATVVPLVLFGGWVTVANLVNPLLLSMERLLIGSLISVAMVGYYTAPITAVTKLWIIPGSLTTTIFPVCSALGVAGKRELESLYGQSTKYLFLVLAPVSAFLFLFARQITHLWLGPEFVSRSGPVLQVLAVGVFFNCFAYLPYCLLQGLGRPDAIAKLLLAELIPYTVFAWWMIHSYGIVGAAKAWSIRVAVEVLLLMVIAGRTFSLWPRLFLTKQTTKGLGALGIMVLAMIGTKFAFQSSFRAVACLSCIWLGAFALTVWKYVLDGPDRVSILTLVTPWRGEAKSESAT